MSTTPPYKKAVAPNPFNHVRGEGLTDEHETQSLD